MPERPTTPLSRPPSTTPRTAAAGPGQPRAGRRAGRGTAGSWPTTTTRNSDPSDSQSRQDERRPGRQHDDSREPSPGRRRDAASSRRRKAGGRSRFLERTTPRGQAGRRRTARHRAAQGRRRRPGRRPGPRPDRRISGLQGGAHALTREGLPSDGQAARTSTRLQRGGAEADVHGRPGRRRAGRRPAAPDKAADIGPDKITTRCASHPIARDAHHPNAEQWGRKPPPKTP